MGFGQLLNLGTLEHSKKITEIWFNENMKKLDDNSLRTAICDWTSVGTRFDSLALRRLKSLNERLAFSKHYGARGSSHGVLFWG